MKAQETPIQNSDKSTPPKSVKRPKRLGQSVGATAGEQLGGASRDRFFQGLVLGPFHGHGLPERFDHDCL